MTSSDTTTLLRRIPAGLLLLGSPGNPAGNLGPGEPSPYIDDTLDLSGTTFIDDDWRLPGVREDPKTFRDFLTSRREPAFLPHASGWLSSGGVAAADPRAAIARFLSTPGPEIYFLCYSGHRSSRGDGAWMFSSFLVNLEDVLRIWAETFRSREVATMATTRRKRLVVISDSCHSGAWVDRLAAMDPRAAPKGTWPSLASSVAVQASCLATEQAMESGGVLGVVQSRFLRLWQSLPQHGATVRVADLRRRDRHILMDQSPNSCCRWMMDDDDDHHHHGEAVAAAEDFATLEITADRASDASTGVSLFFSPVFCKNEQEWRSGGTHAVLRSRF